MAPTDKDTQDLEWRDNAVPISKQFDDPYFSLENGLAETEHVFLAGNALPDRFRDGFHIAELGFGTGLNLLAALRLWRTTRQTGVLHFTSFEAFPISPENMTRALMAFPDLADLVDDLAPRWSDLPAIDLPDLKFRLVMGDARDTLERWTGMADAWFLDGFSPAKNPELWEPHLLQHVYDHTHSGGTVATYTAAGFVRRGLAEAGFAVSRTPGFGRKRHMIQAKRGPQ